MVTVSPRTRLDAATVVCGPDECGSLLYNIVHSIRPRRSQDRPARQLDGASALGVGEGGDGGGDRIALLLLLLLACAAESVRRASSMSSLTPFSFSATWSAAGTTGSRVLQL